MRTALPTQGDISLQKIHAGATRWTYEVRVAGLTFRDVNEAKATYDKDGRGVLSLDVNGDLRPFRRQKVALKCGYGSPAIEWFSGYLGKPHYDRLTGRSSAEAYGVSGKLARASFDKPMRYQGYTFAGFFADLRARLLDPAARLEVQNGQRIALENAVFQGEVFLLEAAESVISPAEYVLRDRPGYKLVVMPRPRPGAIGSAKAVYAKAQLPPLEPKMQESLDGPWYKVVVYRRDQGGDEIVRAEAKIANRGPVQPTPNEIYYVHDYQGTQAEAQAVVAPSTAAALSQQPYTGSLTGIAANPELMMDDQVGFLLEEEDGGVLYERTYAAMVGEIELDAVAASTSFAFEALRTDQRAIAAPRGGTTLPPGMRRINSSVTSDVGAFGLTAAGQVYARLGSRAPHYQETVAGGYIKVNVGDGVAFEDALGQLWVKTT